MSGNSSKNGVVKRIMPDFAQLKGFDHGGQIHQYAARHGFSVNDIIDFSANINPHGPPTSVLGAIQSALPVIRHYPDPNHTEVKSVLAQQFQVDSSQILCGNGATEVIDLLLQYLKPTRVVVLEPAFSEYRKSANRYGFPVLSLSLLESAQLPARFGSSEASDASDGQVVQPSVVLPLDQLDTLLCAGDVVFLNTPHNPTGTCFKPSDWLTNAREWQERGVRVIVDESFLDFMPNESDYTMIAEAVKSKALFVIRSATKFYALPGLRFGFAIGSPRHFHQIEQNRDGWSVNQLAQIAAVEAYQDKKFQLASWEWLQREHEHVRQLWTGRPNISLLMGQANFFLLQFHIPETGKLVEQHLQSRGMLIRNCSNFAGLEAGSYRIAIRTEIENRILAEEVTTYL